MKKYPDIKLVGNSKTFTFLPQFFDIQNLDSKKIEVKEGEILDLGNHKLKFIMAPMVHWPELMMTYEEKEKTKNNYYKCINCDCNYDKFVSNIFSNSRSP